MKRDEVIRKLKDQRQELFDRYGVSELFLFGSVARNEANHDSDIDLFVEFRHPISLFQFIELQQHLESLLGRKVDLGTKRSIKSGIIDSVVKESIRVA